MKIGKIIRIGAVALSLIWTLGFSDRAMAENIPINKTNFPNKYFRTVVLEKADVNKDKVLSTEEALNIRNFILAPGEDEVCDSLQGIELFENVYALDFKNVKQTTLDLRGFKKLTYLYLENCAAQDIYVDQLENLVKIQIKECETEKISSVGCTNLDEIYVTETKLKELQLKDAKNLQSCTCMYTPLEQVTLESLHLETLKLSYTNIKKIDLSKLPNLKYFWIEHSSLEEADFTKNLFLASVSCENNNLKSLDFSNNPVLISLYCEGNALEFLDISKCPLLNTLRVENAKLTSLDLSDNFFLHEGTNGNDSVRCRVTLYKEKDGTFDFATLPNFDISKILYITNGVLTGSVYKPYQGKNSFDYDYDCGPIKMRVYVTLKDHEHQMIHVPYQAPNCVEDGHKEYYVCELCSGWYEDRGGTTRIEDHAQIVIEKNKEHVWDEGTVSLAPTCTTYGERTYHCIKCDEREVTSIEKITHEYENVVIRGEIKKAGKIAVVCKECNKEKSATRIASITKIVLSSKTFTYDGKKKVPKATLKDDKGNVIPTMFYKVSVSATPKKVGTYKAKITLRGLYKGTKTLSYTIVPKGTSFVSVKPNKKAITLAWKKQTAQVDGYEIQYSTSEKFATSATKKLSIKKDSTVSKKVKNLKAKKKYYVRIRTYKKVNGKTYYSDWSKTKSVVTK